MCQTPFFIIKGYFSDQIYNDFKSENKLYLKQNLYSFHLLFNFDLFSNLTSKHCHLFKFLCFLKKLFCHLCFFLIIFQFWNNLIYFKMLPIPDSKLKAFKFQPLSKWTILRHKEAKDFKFLQQSQLLHF